MRCVILKWIVACGKSTYAKSFQKQWYTIHNIDTIMLENPLLKEKDIKNIYWDNISKSVDLKENVVLDNTHINKTTLQESVLRMAAAWYDVDIIDVFLNMMYSEFDGSPRDAYEECVIRNNERSKETKVPTSVIFEMYLKDWYSVWQKTQSSSDTPNVVLVDLDWTLYNIDHRLESKKKTWKIEWLVFENPNDVRKDKVVPLLRNIINWLSLDWYKIIITSWRKNKLCDVTIENLERDGVVFDWILMRQSRDNSKDYDVKKWFWELISKNHNVSWVFDDRRQVLDAWRELWYYTLNCCQQENNDF